MPQLNLTKKRDEKPSASGKTRQIKTVAEMASSELNSAPATRGRPASRSTARISLVSQSVSTNEGQRIPTARVRISSANEPAEKTFSLVNNQRTRNPATSRHNTCIVCLKINKTLFNQIFQSGDLGHKVVNDSKKKLDSLAPVEVLTNLSAEMQMELSQDKTLDIPEIYGYTELDIQPDRVQFKQYSDIDEECLNQKLNAHGLSDKKIHLILASFKNKSWPDSSQYACWNCTEFFEQAPVGIPTIAMSESYEDKYYLEGNFCSFNCAARYLFDTCTRADNELWTIFEIMNFIYNEVNDSEEYEKIKLAPERICLKKFGGHLTLEEYRKNHHSRINYEVFRSPLIPALYHIQENVDLTRLIKAARNKRNP